VASQEQLVERIVRLQKSLARRAEKEEFYEEHVTQLVAELQKKNKIIDYFVMKEETGTMPDNRADAVKVRALETNLLYVDQFVMKVETGTMPDNRADAVKVRALETNLLYKYVRKYRVLATCQSAWLLRHE
jgi:hypothetical protein